MRRVVITGMGAISALGHSAAAHLQAMREGRSGIDTIRVLDPALLKAPIAAEVRDFDPAAHFDEKKLAMLDRVSQFALVAAREAVAQSGVDFAAGQLGAATAIVVGSGAGGENTHDQTSRRLYAENNQRLHPLTIVRLMFNAPASQISMEFGVTGPAFAVASACASTNHAIAQALQMVRSGAVEMAITGGTEACITLGVIRAWEAMRVLADDTCRPFSRQRRGLVLGEGAGMFVIESEEHALARGAPILAELAGAGMSSDAADVAFPSRDGAAAAIRRALADAQLQPAQVDYVNAHGTGTIANDATETAAIRAVFGAHADRLAVSSTKSMHGHALGASGALELVATIGALQSGWLPPTMNFLDPDPQCDLDYVPNQARKCEVRAALSNSFAFGGLNAVLAVRRWE